MKKNICFLIAKFDNKSGTERVTADIANILANQYNVTILTLKGTVENGFPVDKEVTVNSLHNDLYQNKIKKRMKLCLDLMHYLKTHSVDIVINVDITLSLLSIPLKKMYGFKVISWEHFNYYEHHTLESRFTRFLSAKYADTLVVLGKNDLESYRSHFKKHTKLEYIYNPIALELEPVSTLESKNVLAVGRLELQKGFDLLLQAWQKVERRFPEWALQIVGSGSQEKQLEQMIKEFSLRNVKMVAYTDEIEKFYLNSSLFVLSSRFEGFVLVLLEAQAKGLPIVSFDCKEGPAEIVDRGKNGELVKNGDVNALADAICKLIGDEKLLKKYGKKAQKDLGRFDKDSIGRKWCEIIDECLTRE